jgi:hypothetical protein
VAVVAAGSRNTRYRAARYGLTRPVFHRLDRASLLAPSQSQAEEDVRLKPSETYSVRAGRPHLVTNAGKTSATFLVLQGIGEYDFIPLV